MIIKITSFFYDADEKLIDEIADEFSKTGLSGNEIKKIKINRYAAFARSESGRDVVTKFEYLENTEAPDAPSYNTKGVTA